MSDKREPCSVLGYYIGTATGWDTVDDWSLVFYGFEPYEGFEMPVNDLTVDFVTGNFVNYDDEGNETESKNMLTVLNGFVAREHRNKKKVA